MRTKVIEVGGEKYTLTAKRSIIIKFNEICPEALKLETGQISSLSEEDEINASIRLSVNMDILFYDMIKIAHPDLSKDESDDIYEKFLEEYSDVVESLVKFIKSVFTGGIPKENKKKLNW